MNYQDLQRLPSMIVCRRACVNKDTGGSSGGYNGSAGRPDVASLCGACAAVRGLRGAHPSRRPDTNV
jgi:hypothetical protein